MRDLSVILPVYNGEPFIEKNIISLNNYLNNSSLSYEIIVVDDGSTDNTTDIIAKQKNAKICPVILPKNHGKGFAVKSGMSIANGRCRMFMDADLPFDLEVINYAVDTILNREFHMVLGDRSLQGSIYHSKLGFVRKLTNWCFRFFIRTIVTGGVFDTQCGFKAFRGDIATELFPLLKFSGFEFDVELYYIALKYNMEMKKVPVRLQGINKSTVKPFADGISMMINVLSLRRNWLNEKYYSRNLHDLCEINYWK